MSDFDASLVVRGIFGIWGASVGGNAGRPVLPRGDGDENVMLALKGVLCGGSSDDLRVGVAGARIC